MPAWRWRGWLPVALLLLLHPFRVSSKQPVTEPDYTLYHSANSLSEDIIDIVKQCSSSMTLSVMASGFNTSYNSTLTVVTVEPGGTAKGGADDKLRILVGFGQHGRELVSPEIGLNLLRALCEPAPWSATTAAVLRRVAPGEDWAALPALLRRTVWKVLPIENTAGRRLVENGTQCERRNGRGVDLNRNWGLDWGRREPDYDPNEEYPGTAAFSEPETRMVRGAARAFKPHVWIAVHSGMKAMFMPWDHRDGVPGSNTAEAVAANATLGLLRGVNDAVFGGTCVVGPGGKSVGYLAHGTATDYMYGELGVPVSLTWEVYGDTSAPFEDCFRAFNPVKRETYEAVVEAWMAAFFSLVLRAREHPVLGPLLTARGQALGLGRKAEPKQVETAPINGTSTDSLDEAGWRASARQGGGELALDIDQALPWAGLSLAVAAMLLYTLKRKRTRD